jgi:hypothetical protein
LIAAEGASFGVRRASVVRKYRRVPIAPVIVLVTLCSCGRVEDLLREPDVTPVRNVLKAAMPVGYAANLTMAAMQGVSLPNVNVLRSGSDTSTGCFLVEITVDSAYPLPGDVQAVGIITTAGIIVDNRTAIMSAVFSGLNITRGSFVVRDISTFPVVADTDIISGKRELDVVYCDVDVNSGSDTLLRIGIDSTQISAELVKYRTMKSFDSGVTLTENAWIIRVDDSSTLANPADDTYAAWGGGQYVEVFDGKTEIVQLTMIDAAMSPACKYNPASGWAFWQNMGADRSGPDIGHVFLTFHPACDGKARVTAATGVYVRSFGRDIALGLDQ